MSNKSLKDESVRIEILNLYQQGIGPRELGRKFGIPHNTISDFLNKKTYKSWTEEYQNIPKDTKPRENINQPNTVKYPEPLKIITSTYVAPGCTHGAIPDTQTKDGIDLRYCTWIGKYLADKKPDVIIHGGDHFDMPSLCSYDRGTKKAEGRRLHEDIAAGIKAMNMILKPIYDLQQRELALYGEVLYKPKMVYIMGNHEERLMRHINANPELAGFVSYDNFRLKDNGWEVYDFLEPARVHGVNYIHYVPNPMTGKPMGGSAQNILNKVGESFTMFHIQKLDYAVRSLLFSGRRQRGLIAGACYPHEEGYKGYTGNNHWRGMILKHNVKDGDYEPMFVNLNYLEERYGTDEENID